MNLKTRRILYIHFILAFFLISPLLILYAAGYKLQLGWPLKIKKTAAIIIESNPKNAQIFINNKKIKINRIKNFFKKDNSLKTPAKIKNLFPGKYKINVKLENYWPWEKIVSIESGELIHLENIELYKKGEAKKIFSSISKEKDFFSISPNKNKLLINNQIINFQENNKLISFDNETLINHAFWSKTENKIIINQRDLFFLDQENKKININNKIKKELEKIKFDDKNDIYFLNDNKISKISLLKNKDDINLKEIIKFKRNKNIVDFLILKNNIVLLISNNNQNTELSFYSLDGEFQKATNLNLKSLNYRFENLENNWLKISDQKKEITYLINNNYQEPVKFLIPDSKEIVFLEENIFYYFNDYEIWKFNLNKKEKKLVLKIGEKIKNIFPLFENDIIYNTDNSINVFQTKNNKNINLLNFNNIDFLSFNPKNNIIHFIISEKNNINLYNYKIN